MLTIEELKSLQVGDWVWVIKGETTFYAHIACLDYNGVLFDKCPHSVWINFSDYGTKWIANKNKEQAEGGEERIRKETAKEIYNAVIPLLIMKNKKYGNDPMTMAANEWFEKKVKEIFEPFGVEVSG